MKRLPMPQRKTPLRVGNVLRRYTPLQSTSLGIARTSLKPVSDKRRRAQPERRRVVNALVAAQAGRCARCGTRAVLHGHERLGMAHGADYVHPDVAVCDPCNGAIEDEPRVSAWNGWKLSTRWPHDPALQPWEARALDGSIVDFTVLAGDAA